MTNAVKSLYILYKIVKKAAPKTILLLRSLSLEDEGMGGKKESVHLWGNANVGGQDSFAKQTFSQSTLVQKPTEL